MWIRELLVDILVTLFIAAALWLDDIWMRYILIAYSALLLIAKAVILSGDRFLAIVHRKQTTAPESIPYLLYALNTALLLWQGWWYLAAAWAVIGLLSWFARIRLSRISTTR